jgi:hypothetical protein
VTRRAPVAIRCDDDHVAERAQGLGKREQARRSYAVVVGYENQSYAPKDTTADG